MTMTFDNRTVDWTTWTPQDRAVLLFLFHQDQVLLIHKKRGLGQGKVNAPGGRLEPGETYREAAIRETQEEVGLTPLNPVEVAELLFAFTDGYDLYGRVFFATQWEGTLIETDEALPFWCPVTEIPWEKMWEDDRLWLPRALEGHWVSGRFLFKNDEMGPWDLRGGPGGEIEHFFKG